MILKAAVSVVLALVVAFLNIPAVYGSTEIALKDEHDTFQEASSRESVEEPRAKMRQAGSGELARTEEQAHSKLYPGGTVEALYFDGVDDHVVIKDEDLAYMLYAVNLWVFRDAETNQSTPAEGLLDFGWDGNLHQGVYIGSVSTTMDAEVVTLVRAVSHAYTYMKTPLAAGWNMLTFNWERTGSGFEAYSIYLNAEKQDVRHTNWDGDHGAGLWHVPAKSEIRPGRKIDSFYRGAIDELAFFSAALSPENISALYRSRIKGAPSPEVKGLIGLWHFDRPSGDTESVAMDSSQRGNNGIIHGARHKIMRKGDIRDQQEPDTGRLDSVIGEKPPATPGIPDTLPEISDCREIPAVDEFLDRRCDKDLLSREVTIVGNYLDHELSCTEEKGRYREEKVCTLSLYLGNGDSIVRVQRKLHWARSLNDEEWIAEGDYRHLPPSIDSPDLGLRYRVKGRLSKETLLNMVPERVSEKNWAAELLPTSEIELLRRKAAESSGSGAPVIEASEVFNFVCPVNDEVVTLRGLVAPGLMACTKLACGPANPCCNSCSGGAVLRGERFMVNLENSEIVCGGNECNPTCKGINPGWDYYAAGRLRYEYGELYLDTIGYKACPGIDNKERLAAWSKCSENHKKILKKIDTMNRCQSNADCTVLPYGSSDCSYPLAVPRNLRMSPEIISLERVHSFCIQLKKDLDWDKGVTMEARCMTAELPPQKAGCDKNKCVLKH